MLVSDMILRVRESLHDMDADRCSDERIVGAFNLGILDMRRMRPDFFIGRFSANTYQIATPAEEYNLPETTIPIIIKYATGWIELSDEEVSDSGRASLMMTTFRADLSA